MVTARGDRGSHQPRSAGYVIDAIPCGAPGRWRAKSSRSTSCPAAGQSSPSASARSQRTYRIPARRLTSTLERHRWTRASTSSAHSGTAATRIRVGTTRIRRNATTSPRSLSPSRNGSRSGSSAYGTDPSRCAAYCIAMESFRNTTGDVKAHPTTSEISARGYSTTTPRLALTSSPKARRRPTIGRRRRVVQPWVDAGAHLVARNALGDAAQLRRTHGRDTRSHCRRTAALDLLGAPPQEI
jgi:hypothetical protein